MKIENERPQGLKFDNDKPMVNLLDPDALEEVARVLTFGASKYGARNWEKGINYSRLLGATLRHVFAVMKRQDIDDETGLHHTAHAICELMFLLHFQLKHRLDLDDR